MAKLSEDNKALIQAEITRLLLGYEKPFPALVIQQLSHSWEDLGFESRGHFTEKLKLSPYSTLFQALRNLMGQADGPAYPGEVANLLDEVLELYQGEPEKPSINAIIVDRLLAPTDGQNVASVFGYDDIAFAEALRLRPFSTLLTLIVAASDRIS